MKIVSNKSRSIFMGLFCLLVIGLFLTTRATASVSDHIRVGLMQNGVNGTITVQGNYVLVDTATGQTLASMTSEDSWEATAQGGTTLYVKGEGDAVPLNQGQKIFGINISGVLTEVAANFSAKSAESSITNMTGLQLSRNGQYSGVYEGPLMVKEMQHNNHNLVSFNGIKYRGDLELRYVSGKLTVVNELPLEEYLYGVVPREMPSSWHPEALKAQAVSARNYAIEQKKSGKYATSGFDIMPTDASQVYGGYSAEKVSTNSAVDATKGKVLLYNGQLISAFFHSSSGGATENSEEIWTSKVGYLRTRPDSADVNTLHYNWQKSFTPSQLLSQLTAKGYQFSEVTDLVVEKQTLSGMRIQILQVIGKDAGGQVKILRLYNGDKVRTVFGLKSGPREVRKDMTIDGTTAAFTFSGNGWGHGLGMSQYGANGLAKAGNSFEEILKHYYTGVELVDNYNGL